MDAYSNQINKLIEELSKLPGIGAKSAQRLASTVFQSKIISSWNIPLVHFALLCAFGAYQLL